MVRSNYCRYLLLCLVAAILVGDAAVYGHNNLRTGRSRNERRESAKLRTKTFKTVRDALREEALKEHFAHLIAKQSGMAVDTDDYNDDDGGTYFSTMTYWILK